MNFLENKMKNNKTRSGIFFLIAILSVAEVLLSVKTADAATVSTPYAWVPNVSGGTVSKIDTANGSVSTGITVNSGPQSVAVDTSGFVWVANFNSDNVSKISASTGSVVATIAVGSHPQGVALDSSGYVWVTNYGNDNVSKIDPSSDSVLKTVGVGIHPSLIAADSSGHIWVTNGGGNSVSKINVSTDTVEATIPVGTAPKGIAVDLSGFVWVANTVGNMTKINPSTDSESTTVNAGGGSYGVTVDANGYVWATDYGSNNVAKIDPSTNSVIATVGSFHGPAGIAADVSGNVWVVNSGNNTVSKVDGTTNAILSTVNVGNTPFGWGDFTGFAYQHIVRGLPLWINAPTVTLSSAGSVGVDAATLNGNVTGDGNDTGNVDVVVYWGATDGGTTPSSWGQSVDLGTQGVAAFAKGLTGLNPGTKYYFSASVTNSVGTSWPGASLDFTTGLPTLTGSPAIASGTPVFGTELTVGTGTLSPSTDLTYTWYRSADRTYDAGDTNLGSGTTYVPAADDIGSYLIVVVSSADATGMGYAATDGRVENAGDSASVGTDNGNATLVAPDGFASGNLTLHIAKLDVSTAPAPPSGDALVGDNFFRLTATDETGNIVDAFDKPIAFTVSYGPNIGSRYVESTLAVYKNDNGSWIRKDCSLDADADTLTCDLSSFSDYAVFGEPVPDGSKGDGDGAEKARIDSWKAYAYENTNGAACSDRLRLTIEGRHFAKGAEVRIGNRKADDVDRKNSHEITAGFCMDDLLAVKTDLKRKIRVINPDAEEEESDRKIDLDGSDIRFTETGLDPDDSHGVMNIQKTLVRLGYLDFRYATGFYGPITAEAVGRFQTDNGLERVGAVGPLTRAKLAEKTR